MRYPPLTDQIYIDTFIEEVIKDAEAEVTKIAAGEATKSAAEEAAKGPAGEASKAAAGEAGKAAAEEAAKEPAGEGVADDQPSSPATPAPGKYLRVGDDLFIRLPGMASTRAPAEGEVFNDEALATAGLQVVDEPSASGDSSQEEQLLRAMSANFQKLQALHRAHQDKAIATTLRVKDEEIEKLVMQQTQELERKHKDALDALALDQADKVEKLELEREELKKEVSKLTEDRDRANCTLADLQVTISDKTKLLSEANNSINDLKLKLDTLEETLSEVKAREEALNKALESERQLRKDDAAAHKDYVDTINLRIGRLIDVAGKLTTQLAAMGMPHIRYSQEVNISPNSRMTLFFERVLDALEQLPSNCATYLANELTEAEVTEAVKKILNESEAGDDPFWKKKAQDKPAKTPRPKTKDDAEGSQAEDAEGTPHSSSGESTATQLPPLKTVHGTRPRPSKKARLNKSVDDNVVIEPEKTPDPVETNTDALLDDPPPQDYDFVVEQVEVAPSGQSEKTTSPVRDTDKSASPAKATDKPSTPVKAAGDKEDDIMITGFGHTDHGNPVALSKHSAKDELSAMGKVPQGRFIFSRDSHYPPGF
nr:titin homolog [Aegilops tauschii subsp. strangulata]